MTEWYAWSLDIISACYTSIGVLARLGTGVNRECNHSWESDGCETN